MFLHLSVILFTGGRGVWQTPPRQTQTWADTPWVDTPTSRQTPGQTPPWADTTLDRHPLGRHPWADTPPGRHPPRADTPPGRHPPGRHPPGRHPPGRHPPPGRHTPGQLNLATESVADSGFPRRGRVPTPGFGQTPIIWSDFYRKLHENERNWSGGRASLTPPWISQWECRTFDH